MRDAGAGDFSRRPVGHRLAGDADDPGGHGAQPGDDFRQLALAVAGDAGDAQRLASADLQIDASQRGQAIFAERARRRAARGSPPRAQWPRAVRRPDARQNRPARAQP